MLKLRGRGWVLKMKSCLQASQLWDTQAGRKAGMGEQKDAGVHLPPLEADGGGQSREASGLLSGKEQKNLAAGKHCRAGQGNFFPPFASLTEPLTYFKPPKNEVPFLSPLPLPGLTQ